VEPNDYYGKIVAQLRSNGSLLLCQAKVALINGVLQVKSGLITEARDRALGPGFLRDVFVTGFKDFHQTLEVSLIGLRIFGFLWKKLLICHQYNFPWCKYAFMSLC
jgi:hypothetical protein